MDKKDKQIYNAICKYLSYYINEPIKQLIDKNPIANLKIATQFSFIKILTENTLESKNLIDETRIRTWDIEKKEEYLSSLKNFIKTGNEDNNTKYILENMILNKSVLPYIFREMNWILISILSASYISSHILIRSIFELIINYMTSKKNCGMADRIDAIGILDSNQKKYLKKHWRSLNEWAHPYEHWLNSTCPIYIMHTPMYHEKLCDDCIYDLQINIELLIIMSLKVFMIDPKVFSIHLEGKELFQYKLLLDSEKKYFV